MAFKLFQTTIHNKKIYIFCFFFFLRFYLFLFRGDGMEKERKRNINVWLPLGVPPTGDLACNPGMCPDWESNQ